MAIDADSVGGELVGRERGHVVRFPSGRVCAEPGCLTHLSIYNSRPKCAEHDFDASLMNFRSPVLHDDGRRRSLAGQGKKASAA